MRLQAILAILLIAGSAYAASTIVETSKLILTNNSLSIFGTDETNPTDAYTLQDNGIRLSAPTLAGNWIKWLRDGNTNWALGTFQGENDEYIYLHNNQTKQQPLTISEGGRFGINTPANVMNYHSLWNQLGVDNIEVAGVYDKASVKWYQVSISSTGVVDTWTWGCCPTGTNYTPSYITNDCSFAPVTMDSGVTIAFGAVDGHLGTEIWQFPAFPQIPSATLSARPSIFTEVLIATNKNTNNAVWIDRTFDAGFSGSTPWDGITSTNDVMMMGQNRKGNSIFIQVAQPAAGITLVCEYWTALGWASVSNMVDNTANLTVPGDITFEKSYMTDWTRMQPDGEDSGYNLYWLRIRSSTTPTQTGNWIQVTPQGTLRFAVYVSGFGTIPKMYVDSQGNSYMDRAFRNSVDSYGETEYITLSKANALIASAIASAGGSIVYPVTNIATVGAPSLSLFSTIPTYSFAYTNAVASGTNTIVTFISTNTFGTNSLGAGQSYELHLHALCAGTQTRSQWQLISVNPAGTVTNTLYDSDFSAILPNLDTSVTLPLTVVKNTTVPTTNYYGVRVLGVRTGNAGNLITRFGATEGSKLAIGPAKP